MEASGRTGRAGPPPGIFDCSKAARNLRAEAGVPGLFPIILEKWGLDPFQGVIFAAAH